MDMRATRLLSMAILALVAAVPPVAAGLAVPSFSDEFGFGDVVLGEAWNGQHDSAIASNGTDFLVVWTDHRGSLAALPEEFGGAVVCCFD